MSVKNCESCGRFFNDQGLSDLFGPDFDKYCSPECARKVVGAIDRDVEVGDETQSDSDGISLLPTAGGYQTNSKDHYYYSWRYRRMRLSIGELKAEGK